MARTFSFARRAIEVRVAAPRVTVRSEGRMGPVGSCLRLGQKKGAVDIAGHDVRSVDLHAMACADGARALPEPATRAAGAPAPLLVQVALIGIFHLFLGERRPQATPPPRLHALLADEQTAGQLVAAAEQVMRRRHGDQVQLLVEPTVFHCMRAGSADEARVLAKVGADTRQVLARIKTGNFAPNKAPVF